MCAKLNSLPRRGGKDKTGEGDSPRQSFPPPVSAWVYCIFGASIVLLLIWGRRHFVFLFFVDSGSRAEACWSNKSLVTIKSSLVLRLVVLEHLLQQVDALLSPKIGKKCLN